MSKYVIINSEAIQKRIEEWEVELQECFKAPVGEFNSHYVSTLQQAITTAGEILSHSTPLIPEIEKAFDASKEGWYQQKENLQSSCVGKFHGKKEDYISNLKLDI